MLSVLIIPGKHLKRQERMLHNQLRGEDYEVITTPTWNEGLAIAKGDYVCFLERESTVSDNYFHDLLDTFLEQPSFRKLAFVSPSINKPSWLSIKRIFGYKIEQSTIVPNFLKGSIFPYSIQVGYLPGAIIRKSVINKIDLDDLEKDPVMGSVRMSLKFWSTGQRCLIDPRAVYTTFKTPIEMAIIIKDGLPKDIKKLVGMFVRESI
jgi:hypothetical protein